MTKLNSVRKGDRAEYISQGIFSALGYSLPILRQEDFGIDFLCTVVEQSGKVSYPTQSFTIQLKTNHENIVYDLSNAKRTRWLIENNLPFFICYFDTNNNRVDFYSTSMLSNYLISKPDKVSKISFKMDSVSGACTIPQYEHKKGNKIFKIDMGKPFLSISIFDLSNESLINKYRKIITKVLRREYENIVYRNLNLPFMRWLHGYETNKEGILFGWSHFSDLKSLKSQNILECTGHIIISLCYNYKEEGKTEDFNKLKEYVLRLPFNNEFKSSLVTMGFRDEQGNEILL
jgi:hypothetical protein